ncbi:MAG: hypothetical protein ACUVX8_05135, partial [Candidatus Zipacnadales bacterium]
MTMSTGPRGVTLMSSQYAIHCCEGVRRVSLQVALLLLGLVVGPLAGQPAAITGLYEEIRIAIELEDGEAIRSRFEPLLQLQASIGQSWLTELSAMFTRQEQIAAEVKFDDVEVVGPRALVLVSWAFGGTTAETGEAWAKTIQRADVLVLQKGMWRISSTAEVDREALRTKVTENQFSDLRNGLEVTAPRNWRLYPMAGAKTAVMAYSPDFTTSIAWIATDLPGAFTAQQLAESQRNAMDKLGATIGVTFRNMTQEPEVFAGQQAYRLRYTVVAADGSDTYSDLTFCVVGSTLYLCARTAMPASAYTTYAEAIERSVATTRIVEMQTATLPPEAGRIEGRIYITDRYGCEITAPPGWEIHIGQGQFKLQVTILEPGGKSNVTLGMIELPVADLTAEQAVLADDNLTSKAFDDFTLVKRGPT